MNQENHKEGFVKKNNVMSILSSDLRESASGEGKETSQREMGILRGKSKGKIAMRPTTAPYVQCFPAGNFTSQDEDECPVNYSLKYSETESCKYVNKPETSKKKFKDYADYAETDLDQPTDFSLKYAEKTYDDENKNIAFTYYNNNKVKFKEYNDYVETDLDQPTDFTLKYRESAEEDMKNEFNFYENEERKTPAPFGARTEEPPCERLPGRFPSQDETPLMFSRSSSLNSLSSFVHITQSIPDDRSSVVSDFSRMTSGIISPSELPDSPTQTAPSSPKRIKPPPNFPKPDFLAKKSVFEDDVATYKQEDTPIEFSRATSLSSLNIDNPKSDLVIKQHSGPSNGDLSKDDAHNSEDMIRSEHLKQDLLPEKLDHEKGKFELASVLEVDESLFADCISIDIQINCRKPKPSHQGRLIVTNEGNAAFRPSNGFTLKPNLRLRFQSENRKGYAPYELSDDAVHTYHTEGTPANVSHAGSHSDLSALSIASGIPLSVGDDNSDSESFFPEGGDAMCTLKDETLKENMQGRDISESLGRGASAGYLGEDHQEKDEEPTSFGIESSPCDFLTSSLGDLTVDVMNPLLSIARTDVCEETPSQILSPLRNVSPQSPNSIIFEEADDAEKVSEELESDFISAESMKEETDAWEESNGGEDQTEQGPGIGFSDSGNIDLDSDLPLTAFEEALLEECIRLGMPGKKKEKQKKGKRLEKANFKLEEEGKESGEGELSIDLESIVPLTAFEEALLEECIRLGMPQRRKQELQETHFELNDEVKETEDGEVSFSKSISKEGKCWNGKKFEPQSLCAGAGTPNSIAGDNFDFDSSEPLTAFEEVLLEQCIQLGMPQKRNCKSSEVTQLKQLDEGPGDFECDSSGLITPLETALVEQCIRLGMPQKKNQKKEGSTEESHKTVSCLTAHLNRLKLNAENEKDKEAVKKCEPCQCGKRHAFRRKNAACRRTKNKSEHPKAENYSVLEDTKSTSTRKESRRVF